MMSTAGAMAKYAMAGEIGGDGTLLIGVVYMTSFFRHLQVRQKSCCSGWETIDLRFRAIQYASPRSNNLPLASCAVITISLSLIHI